MLISGVINLPLFGVNRENARDQFFALFEFYNPICSRKISFNPKRIKTRERNKLLSRHVNYLEINF